jgi:2,5-diamino-6-(ribosylamino)-4(3H)-pyrimidinone 5'-phosphate reductase
MDHLETDIGLFYELAACWKEDATLAGTDTLLAAVEVSSPEEEETSLEPITEKGDDTRPLLVVPDSRGRLRHWNALLQWPFWRKGIALCSHKTPKSHLDYLKASGIEYLVCGEDHVDFHTALEELNTRYGVKTVRVDSGGTLNGILLRAGLVDEVSVLINPCLVGGMTPSSLYRGPDLSSSDDVIQLRLISVEKLKENLIWLRYEVVK